MKCYEMFELQLNGNEPEGSWAEVNVSAAFECEGEKKTVKGFYDGDGVYKVRFLPQKTGTYTWKVEGAVQAEGQEECTASTKSHGMVKAVGTHFEYEDGTKYLPFGTTIYALAHQSEDLIEQTLESLKNAPFNKVIRFSDDGGMQGLSGVCSAQTGGLSVYLVEFGERVRYYVQSYNRRLV